MVDTSKISKLGVLKLRQKVKVVLSSKFGSLSIAVLQNSRAKEVEIVQSFERKSRKKPRVQNLEWKIKSEVMLKPSEATAIRSYTLNTLKFPNLILESI